MTITTKTLPGFDNQSFLSLIALLSPSFPIGSFAYSHGLEQAVAARFITNGDELSVWLEGILHYGSSHNDAILLRAAYDLAKDNQPLEGVVDMAYALCSCRERYMETHLQGKAFLDHAQHMGFINRYDISAAPYPVAVGVVAAFFAIPLAMTLAGFLHSFMSNLVQVAIRLGVIGQMDGIKQLRHLHPIIVQFSENSENLTIDKLGTASMMAEISAMQHETLYSRIFRT